MFVAAFNASDTPVQIEDDGSQLAAESFGVVNRTKVHDLISAGTLHVFTSIEDGPGQNPDAVDAFKEAQRLNAEAAEAKSTSKSNKKDGE